MLDYHKSMYKIEVVNSCECVCVGSHELDCGKVCDCIERNTMYLYCNIFEHFSFYCFRSVYMRLGLCECPTVFLYTYIRSECYYILNHEVEHEYVQNQTKRSWDNKRQMKYDCTLYNCSIHIEIHSIVCD